VGVFSMSALSVSAVGAAEVGMCFRLCNKGICHACQEQRQGWLLLCYYHV
jgi:hypothetical protein